MRGPITAIACALIVPIGIARAQAQDPPSCDVEAPDSDGDGLPDALECFFESDPTRADTDGDGLSDGVEVLTLRTSPVSRDTDGDGACDGDIVVGCDFGEDIDGDGNITLQESDPRCPDVSPARVGNEVGGSRVGCAATGGALPWVLLFGLRRRRRR